MNIMNKVFHFPMKVVILRTLVKTTPQDRSRNILLILTYSSRKKSTKATKTDSDLICFLLQYFKLNYITSGHLVQWYDSRFGSERSRVQFSECPQVFFLFCVLKASSAMLAGKVSISTPTIYVVPNTTRTIDQCQIRPQLNYNSKKLPKILRTCLNLH